MDKGCTAIFTLLSLPEVTSHKPTIKIKLWWNAPHAGENTDEVCEDDDGDNDDGQGALWCVPSGSHTQECRADALRIRLIMALQK